METNRSIFSVMKSDDVRLKIIIKNVITMLSNRIYIDKNGDKHALLSLSDTLNNYEDRGDNTFIVTANNGDKYAIKIIFQIISAIGKQSIISEFFDEYNNYKKIIVAEGYNTKINKVVSSTGSQIFRESAFLSDLISHSFQPKFELLSPKEMELFKNEYNATTYTTKKITKSDPVTKYFALKVNDIIRIVRPSITSGESIDYRIVIQ
nr:DNA dependent RNA polymerase 2 subunit Rpb5 [Mimivirus sp.]